MTSEEETMEPQEFEKLPDAEKERIARLIEDYGECLHKLIEELREQKAEIENGNMVMTGGLSLVRYQVNLRASHYV